MLHQMLDQSWDSMERRRARDPVCGLLRRELARVAREFEAMSYERLLERAEPLSFDRKVDGRTISFLAEAFQIDPNGDVHFCVDAGANGCVPTWQPSYRFVKRRDGSIYY
jgi:hypothetical protein